MTIADTERTTNLFERRQREAVAHARAVWVAVSSRPQASIRELRHMCGLGSTHAVVKALQRLEQAGYIEHVAGKSRARRVVVPCAYAHAPFERS